MNWLFLLSGNTILFNIKTQSAMMQHLYIVSLVSHIYTTSDGFAYSPPKYYMFQTFFSEEEMRRKHPDKYPKYKYVSDKTGLYCKLPMVPAYIHESGKYFLLNDESSRKITRKVEGTEVVLSNSFNSAYWENDGIKYFMSLIGLGWSERCDSIIKKKINVEEGENDKYDAYDEEDGTERNNKEVERNTNSDKTNNTITDQDGSESLPMLEEEFLFLLDASFVI